MVPWYRKKRGISYLEKPATKEEKEISSVINEYLDILAKHDLKRLTEIFSDNARIHSYAAGNRIVGKNAHIQAISKKISAVHPISMNDVLIRIHDDSNASLRGIFLFRADKKIYGPQLTCFEFKRINNVWRISLQLYINK